MVPELIGQPLHAQTQKKLLGYFDHLIHSQILKYFDKNFDKNLNQNIPLKANTNLLYHIGSNVKNRFVFVWFNVFINIVPLLSPQVAKDMSW